MHLLEACPAGARLSKLVLCACLAMSCGTVPALQFGDGHTGHDQQPGPPPTACAEIVSLAMNLTGVNVRRSDGTVRDDNSGVNLDGCRLVGRKEAVVYREDGWPHDIFRIRLISEGWREDLTRAADGAGSTAFALRRGVTLCLFAAAWDSASPSGQGLFVTGRYRLEAGCFDESR